MSIRGVKSLGYKLEREFRPPVTARLETAGRSRLNWRAFDVE
jgi:hypothetical protein